MQDFRKKKYIFVRKLKESQIERFFKKLPYSSEIYPEKWKSVSCVVFLGFSFQKLGRFATVLPRDNDVMSSAHPTHK